VAVYEPHVAVDPENPDRIAVAAQYGLPGGRGARSLYLWFSEDGGATWSSGRRVPRPRHEGGFTADPLVAFAADGALLFIGDCAPSGVAEANTGLSFDRHSVPTIDRIFERWADVDLESYTTATIGVSRSEDNGRTFSGTSMSGVSVGADKSSVAIDRSPASPHRGAVYLTWFDQTPAVRFARSEDCGRSFSEPLVVDAWSAPQMQQVGVRPDGSVHLIWTVGSLPGIAGQQPAKTDAPADAGSAISHAVSVDGGHSFSATRTIAHNAGMGKVGIPSLAIDPGGHMLFVWGQTDSFPDQGLRPLVQPRHTLYAVRSEDGVEWSAPYALCPWLSDSVHAALPAAFGDGERWWILAYFADDDQTRVVLLRSDDNAQTFVLDCEIDQRPIPVDEISLLGAYLLRFCDDTPQIGDYVGLAAAGNRLAAAFIFPETDDPSSPETAYVALLDR
jgi:hypothetical protein